MAKPASLGDDAPVLDGTTTERLLHLQRTVALPHENVILELARIFERDAERYLGALQDAVASGDADGARRAVHALKGASLSVGAARVSVIAAALETLLTTDGAAALDEAAAARARFLDEVARALHALRALGGD